MTIPDKYAQEIASGLLQDVGVIATPSDIEYIREGIQYLKDRGATDYASLIEMKLNARLNAPHSISMGIDQKTGEPIYRNYRGFSF